MSRARSFQTPPSLAGQTLAAALRQFLNPLSWAEARRLIAARRVRINGNVCLDDARRLNPGDGIQIDGQPATPPPQQQVRILFSDADLAVVEKPAGLQTVRRVEERDWKADRKARQPVLQEIVEAMLTPGAKHVGGKNRATGKADAPRVRAVHRLDQDTSGVMLFALSAKAEQELVRRFSSHQIRRVYHAVIHGVLRGPRTIDTWLVRDRGDGLRGSTLANPRPPNAKRAITHITHITPLEPIGDACTLIECRLETGRTHQIRIHLAEIGHMLCGEKVYLRPAVGAPIVEDNSAAPRQALHSAELEFNHPTTGKPMRFESKWPPDLQSWIARLRGKST